MTTVGVDGGLRVSAFDQSTGAGRHAEEGYLAEKRQEKGMAG